MCDSVPRACRYSSDKLSKIMIAQLGTSKSVLYLINAFSRETFAVTEVLTRSIGLLGFPPSSAAPSVASAPPKLWPVKTI